MKASLIRMFSPPSSDTRNSADREESQGDEDFNLYECGTTMKELRQTLYVKLKFKQDTSVNRLPTKVNIYRILAF